MTKIVAFFTALFTWLGVVLFPAQPVEGVFGETNERVQTEFDEGEFVMGEHDLVVAPDGDDNNSGTADAPLKTFEKAKELLKSSDSDETVTVWFREGTYEITDTVEFTSADKSNVLYRSYPDEKVVFSGAKAISGWSETVINGVNAFVTDIEMNSEGDYFRSLFKGNKRLQRSNYPKEGYFKIADPLSDETVAPEWSPEFFMHSMSFVAHKSDVLDFANVGDVDIRVMHFWCDEILPLHSVNTETGRLCF